MAKDQAEKGTKANHGPCMNTINRLKKELRERSLQVAAVIQGDQARDPDIPFNPGEIWGGEMWGDAGEASPEDLKSDQERSLVLEDMEIGLSHCILLEIGLHIWISATSSSSTEPRPGMVQPGETLTLTCAMTSDSKTIYYFTPL
ncbi:hypothetical protein Y1Q_0021149 [Alligator mississippiensis]|uniref:Uncharacterized protein n=1 Tax=Alligator mississippiensis TaxID=8496 RepID=A0A151MCG8_ALLMI|nr:hypothetical protein Y1Q_0021149 [Alligator mississippiensis]